MKKIRLGLGVLMIIAGAACAWFWFTAWGQQSDIGGAAIRTPEGLAEQLPVFSAALKSLHVDIFAPSDDVENVVMKMNGQLWRRTLAGVILFLAGVSLLLLGRSESKGLRIVMITARSLVVISLCLSCLLMWWSWRKRNYTLPPWEPEAPNNVLEDTGTDAPDPHH